MRNRITTSYDRNIPYFSLYLSHIPRSKTADEGILLRRERGSPLVLIVPPLLSFSFLLSSFLHFATFAFDIQYSYRGNDADSRSLFTASHFRRLYFRPLASLHSANKRQLCNITNCRDSLFAFPVD